VQGAHAENPRVKSRSESVEHRRQSVRRRRPARLAIAAYMQSMAVLRIFR
jgi:hypothetical protein